MKIEFHRQFDKMYNKLPQQIQSKFEEVLHIFEDHVFDERIRNHPLTGEYAGYRSIDVTGDYRAIFREYPSGTYEFVEFRKIGTHSQLYR